MKILVLNCGSSSIKYKLFDMDTQTVMVQGGVEKIGLPDSFLQIKLNNGEKVKIEQLMPEHTVGIQLILNSLVDEKIGCIASLEEIQAVGHRVVHGGEKFNKSVLITPEVKEMMKDKVVVSVVSSWMFDRMETVLSEGTHHISTCPNTPVAVGEGIIIVQDKHSLSDDEYTALMNLLSQIALVEVMDEQHIGIGGTLSGATPAYAAMFIEALGE